MVTLKALPLFYLVLCAAALPKIPLSKRDDLLAAVKRNGVLSNINRIKGEIVRTKSKIQSGLAAFERNTGRVHPAVTEGRGIFSATNNKPALEKLSGISKRATAAESLTDFEEDLWFGTITVGTPPQTFTVDIDTGSSDTFLPAVGCDDTCDGHTLYDTAASETAVDTGEPFTLEFGSGSATGEIFTDTVAIAGLTANSQAVGASNHYSVDFEIAEFPPDGLVGMAFESLSVFGANPLFSTLVEQGTVAPVFGVKLADNGSELFLGGVNPDLFTGSFGNVSLIEESFYALSLQALDLSSETIATVTGGILPAIVDTGTTLMIGDPQGVEIVYSEIPGALDASSVLGPGFFVVPCNGLPTVGVTLGNQIFNVQPDIFNLGLLEDNLCVGGLVSEEDLPFWVLGDIFLRNFYTVFDQGNALVGFATPQ
jgi:cathepsin D